MEIEKESPRDYARRNLVALLSASGPLDLVEDAIDHFRCLRQVTLLNQARNEQFPARIHAEGAIEQSQRLVDAIVGDQRHSVPENELVIVGEHRFD